MADHLDGCVPLRIMAEHSDGRRYWVWIVTLCPVAVESVDD